MIRMTPEQEADHIARLKTLGVARVVHGYAGQDRGNRTPRAPTPVTHEQLEVAVAAHKAERIADRVNKHGAKKWTVGAETFDSKLEAREYEKLKLREKAGEIRGLLRQVKHSLFGPFGVHVGTYTCDFVLEEKTESGDWKRVVADAKSPHTKKLPGWSRTKALMLACHHIEVRELP